MEKFMNKMGYWLHELMASIPKLNQLALFFSQNNAEKLCIVSLRRIH